MRAVAKERVLAGQPGAALRIDAVVCDLRMTQRLARTTALQQGHREVELAVVVARVEPHELGVDLGALGDVASSLSCNGRRGQHLLLLGRRQVALLSKCVADHLHPRLLVSEARVLQSRVQPLQQGQYSDPQRHEQAEALARRVGGEPQQERPEQPGPQRREQHPAVGDDQEPRIARHMNDGGGQHGQHGDQQEQRRPAPAAAAPDQHTGASEQRHGGGAPRQKLPRHRSRGGGVEVGRPEHRQRGAQEDRDQNFGGGERLHDGREIARSGEGEHAESDA